jgi:hypothetical protein
MFCRVSLLGCSYQELARLPPFQVSEIAKSTKVKEKGHHRSRSDGFVSNRRVSYQGEQAKEFIITLEKIENPAQCALDIAAETRDMMLLAVR